MPQEDKQLRIFKSNDSWICELWIEQNPNSNDGYYFEDNVKASNFQDLLIEIGSKNWIDLLSKNEQ